MRLEDFAKALADQARSDILEATKIISKQFADEMKAIVFAVKQAQDDLEYLNDEVNRLTAENKSLAEQLETARKDHARQGETVDRLAQDAASKCLTDALVKDSVKASAEIAALHDRVQFLSEHIAHKDSVAALDGRIGDLMRRIDEVASIKAADGKDGADGFSPDDLHVELGEDGRTIKFALIAGERRVEREVKMPVMIDKGVWRPDKTYEQGDVVTCGGAMWVATDEGCEGMPGRGKGWRLSVKSGRPGRNGRDAVIKAEKRLSIGGAQ